jgi:hypothetical protein
VVSWRDFLLLAKQKHGAAVSNIIDLVRKAKTAPFMPEPSFQGFPAVMQRAFIKKV